MKILVVDDTKQNRHILRKLLIGYGYSVDTVRNGVEALLKARESPPDLIITDVLMPQMDGFQLCRTLKSDEDLKSIPVLLYSATYTHNKSRELALDIGAAGYITKPIEPDKFIKIIEETFEKYGTGEVKPPAKPLEEPVYGKGDSEQLMHKIGAKMPDPGSPDARIEYLNSVRGAIENVNRLIVTEKDRDSLLQKSCDALVEVQGYDAAWIGLLQDDEDFVTVKCSGFAEDVSRFYEDVMGWIHSPCIRNTLAQNDMFTIVDNSEECVDCAPDSACTGKESAIFRLDHAGRLFGLLVISLVMRRWHSQDRASTPSALADVAADDEEESLLKEVASDLAFALHDMEMEKASRAASLYARNLIKASHDPLVTIGNDGRIMDVNRAIEAVTGVSRESLIKSDFSNYFTEPEKAREVYQQIFSQGFVTDYPLTIRHTSGRVTDVLYNATVYRNEAGDVQGAFAAARDITERKLAEKRINEEYRRAEFYIDLMGHDINNLSQVTRGYLELLLRMPDLPSKLIKHAETALDHVVKSAGIISNVKTLSTVRSGELENWKIDIYPAFASAVETAKSQPRDVRINSNITEGRYFIRGNGLLFAVFSNLLNNAVKFDRHDIVEIDVGIGSSGDGWEIGFADRGRGIGNDYKKIIFNRLERAGESTQGSGLGLTIVKHIVESYGGKVWVEDRVRGDLTQGSNFVVLLPKGD